MTAAPQSSRRRASSATPTRASMHSAVRRSATSCSSRPIIPTPPLSSSSRTTGPHRRSSTQQMRSSRRTPVARPSACGQTPARASGSAVTSPTTSTTRRPGSRGRSTGFWTGGAWGRGEIGGVADERGGRSCGVALFYRTNAQSRVFEEVFIRVGLPYKVVGGVRFYERREVRDALAYLRVLVNPADAVSLRRIVNVPKRGIGDRAEACVDAYAERERITFWEALQHAEDVPGLATRSLNAIQEFVTLVDELGRIAAGDATPGDVLEAVLDKTKLVAELQASPDVQDEGRVENLQELA